MTIRTTYAAEAWDKVYDAFSQINFTSYDYDTVKESLLQYLKIYHAEHFNDFIESSELIAVLEMFAYVAELLAYRVDTMVHENFITTAQRKQSVLKLARLISYTAARNIPGRGLVKINTVVTSEAVYDSLGNNLANTTITWNDPNNSNWKEQFFLVMNKALTSKFGNPSKAFQIGDVSMQLYTLNNDLNAFRNGVLAFSVAGNSSQVQMELVPADIDSNGPFERAPDANAQFNIIYASDGKGDGSDFTGFLGFVKQGSMVLTNYLIASPTANRRIELDPINVNDTDVWVYRVDDNGTILENWLRVEALNEQNLYFNDVTSTRKKYEISTLENDAIALLFGDGNFSDMPVGTFQFWTRVSLNQDVNIPKNTIVGQPVSFSYVNQVNVGQTFGFTFSLTAAIQNNAASENIEHIRQSAPSTYYSQNRMVNGQDYNTYPLKDSTILKLKTINRTFAGQPKYIEWNDSSLTYENVKLFGDDLNMSYSITADMVETRLAAKTLIDTFLEPLLQSNALLNCLVHIMATSAGSYGIISYPRRKFIEDNRQIYKNIDGTFVNPYGSLSTGNGSLNEKTAIQAAIDGHWYGDPLGYATINGIQHGIIADPILNPMDDGKLYLPSLPRTIDGLNTYPPGDTGSNLQALNAQESFGLRFNRFLAAFGGGTIALVDQAGVTAVSNATPSSAVGVDYYKHKVEVITIEMTSDATTFTVISSIRGKLHDYSLSAVNTRWSVQAGLTSYPFDFIITNDLANQFSAGDAFVIDISYTGTAWQALVRNFNPAGTAVYKANLNGWWELISHSELLAGGITSATELSTVQQANFDPNDSVNAWVFMVSRNINSTTGEVDSWSIYNRNMKIIAASTATKFWYNQDVQIIDSSTKKPLYDKIRVLRSNLDEFGKPLKKADIYDTVGFVYDENGVVNYNQIEVLPTDTITFAQAGDKTPDNILQFSAFSTDQFSFYLVNVSTAGMQSLGSQLTASEYTYTSAYDITDYANNYSYDAGTIVVPSLGYTFTFTAGAMLSDSQPTSGPLYQIMRLRTISTLDFMWQHFSPVTHLVDPSVTNIHDAFLMTRGYYNNVMDYVHGLSSVVPQPPTPLELRTSYGYLLANKMLSDTVVLHSGKIKLLFGALADQTLRAKFKVVKSATATFSDERIKAEIVTVIDTLFDIQNWDFGDSFYATELISLIHQKLSTQIASVVLVPLYSVNSFGSLFTINSGFDEILQSAATVNDIEIVTALTPTVLRQNR
jgi:hypothetical protein